LITDATSLEQWLPALASHERIALDTEADSLHCYFEKLCLIQITIPGRDVLIDPLAGFSLAPLFEKLRTHTLLIHGADYDLRLLRRSGYEDAVFIFDTMIAARLSGHTEFSLAALLLKYFNVTLAKGSQKANWARRPLPPQMIEYAQNDTRNLLGLAELLEAQLRALDRWEWFSQSCSRVVEATKIVRQRDLDSAWRITGSNDFRGREAAILRALWQWRDEESRAIDRPVFHILSNDELIRSARAVIQHGSDRPERLQGGRLRRFQEAAQAALELPEAEWPTFVHKPRLRATPEQEQRFRQLRKRRDEVAAKIQLDPSLIAPKAALEALAYDSPDADSFLMPWQRELLGLTTTA
jgi:ribonuclease D